MTQDQLTEKERKLLDTLMSAGSYDGDHHKMWSIDQALRVLTDCPLIQKSAVDYRGRTYLYTGYGESDLYKRIVSNYVRGADDLLDEPHELTDAEYERGDYYEWDEGIAP